MCTSYSFQKKKKKCFPLSLEIYFKKKKSVFLICSTTTVQLFLTAINF